MAPDLVLACFIPSTSKWRQQQALLFLFTRVCNVNTSLC
jgi:hypothetical protein